MLTLLALVLVPVALFAVGAVVGAKNASTATSLEARIEALEASIKAKV